MQFIEGGIEKNSSDGDDEIKDDAYISDLNEENIKDIESVHLQDQVCYYSSVVYVNHLQFCV